MSEMAFKMVAEQTAVKHVLTHVARIAYAGAGYSLAEIKETHQKMLEILRGESFPGADPATSDHLAGEIAEAVEKILIQIETGLKEASGEQA